MKTQAFLKFILTSSVWCSVLFSFILPVFSNVGDPNGSKNTPQPGWSLWQPWEKLSNIDFGLSNIDLGADLELQYQCFGEVDTPYAKRKELETYWWRVNNELNYIGSGEIEYGCWQKESFKSTITAVAYQIPLGENYCLQVNSSVTKGLIIHAESNPNAPQVGLINSGETVKVSDVPINIITDDNNNWIEIESPVKGWIANGPPGSRGYLSMCKL